VFLWELKKQVSTHPISTFNILNNQPKLLGFISIFGKHRLVRHLPGFIYSFLVILPTY